VGWLSVNGSHGKGGLGIELGCAGKEKETGWLGGLKYERGWSVLFCFFFQFLFFYFLFKLLLKTFLKFLKKTFNHSINQNSCIQHDAQSLGFSKLINYHFIY
jgi:hypothetical protein